MVVSNVAIRTSTPELIDFFYPKYTRLKEFSPFVDGGVIYEGDSKYLQSFRDAGIPYIYVKGTPEYDLTIPLNLLNFVFSKWDKKPTNKLVDYFKQYEKVNTELEEIVKQIWVTGNYTLEDSVATKRMNLYKLMARGSTFDIMKEFISLSNDMNPEGQFYAVQYFLKNCVDTSGIQSAWVKTAVESFLSSRGGNIQPALMNYLYSPADNIELKLLKLFDTITVIKR